MSNRPRLGGPIRRVSDRLTGIPPVLTVVAMSFATSGCAWVSSYVNAEAIDIQTPPSSTARGKSANFWRDGDALSLRGAVVSTPVSKSPLRGHLDIGVTDPLLQVSKCLTVRPRLGARKTHKRYSVPMPELPAPGSTVRVWHHRSSDHDPEESTPACTGNPTTQGEASG